MLRVGITGQSGFIGTHLFNYLGLQKDKVKRIPFLDEFFLHADVLQSFVKECDVIVHLAAVNRHNDPETIYKTNIHLVHQILEATEAVRHFPKIIFGSSIQEQLDNPFGKSKLEGRKLFEEWSKKHDSSFVGLVIPNVFGPFGNPFYNSVVATFSYQLTHDDVPRIQQDNLLKFIYIHDLTVCIYNYIMNKISSSAVLVPSLAETSVSQLLEKLTLFKELYFDKNIIPPLTNNFDISLFNTFRCFIDKSHYPFFLGRKEDDRGYLVEMIKEHVGGQNFYSVTKPGITRGNHFHIRKIERFCVISGKASIKIRKIGSDNVVEYMVEGQNPCTIDMPIWHTHNITNIGSGDLQTLFWTNEIFNPNDPDTYYETV
jgi:UDP-2-acetamido-2,6-beta-L-arabino-hexul-4-ose reductase